jgi:hypothetical protein
MSFFRVLPTPTRRVLRRISQALKGGPEEVRDGIRLAGGTAPALHLGHRRSHDVDPWVPVEVLRTSTGARTRPSRPSPGVSGPPSRPRPSGKRRTSFNGRRGISAWTPRGSRTRRSGFRNPLSPGCPLRVLAADKAATLAGRRTLRDFLLRAGIPLRELLSLADARMRGFSAYDFARALREFRERADDPAEAEYWPMVMQPVTRDEMERVFREAAERIERAYAKRRDGTREAIRRAHRSSFRRCSRRAWAATERTHRHSSRRRSRRA